MKLIQVMGPGCRKCDKLLANTQQAVDELGIEAVVERVTDIEVIVGLDVFMLPALVVDGAVKTVGSVPSLEEIKRLLL